MGEEMIDGNPIVSHVVRFKDRTTITDTDADTVRDGAVVVWIVRTVCQPPSYHALKKDSDERYRFNIQNVKAAAVLHGELRDGALAYLEDPTQTQGRLVFDAPVYNGEPEPVAVTDPTILRETGLGWLDTAIASLPVDPEDDRVSVYGTEGSDTQRLLQRWDEL